MRWDIKTVLPTLQCQPAQEGNPGQHLSSSPTARIGFYNWWREETRPQLTHAGWFQSEIAQLSSVITDSSTTAPQIIIITSPSPGPPWPRLPSILIFLLHAAGSREVSSRTQWCLMIRLTAYQYFISQASSHFIPRITSPCKCSSIWSHLIWGRHYLSPRPDKNIRRNMWDRRRDKNQDSSSQHLQIVRCSLSHALVLYSIL